ncbi:PDR/VanB family oxidoreductase [Mangrovicoccus ximenensis]|uniref:PDR/VanB family oxidoreductase n=1 Tax=Mangrovicoccus ximenensis TaxID=1911570 RepID=UPI00191BE4DB|nr:PDR/VanB family oxidoreductase [Mangrovicoccus ximenensis]
MAAKNMKDRNQSEDAAAIGMLRLRVKSCTELAEGVLGLRLESPDGSSLAPWTPGAHLDITLPSGLTRSYSLCGNPSDLKGYEIAVLREDAGRGASREIHATQLVGRELAAIAPRNQFALADASEHVFIAGGIGITPLLPMIRVLAEAGRPWMLHYCGRRLTGMPFVETLRELEASGTGSVSVYAADCDARLALEDMLGTTSPGAAVYCCGPERLLQAAEKAALASGRAFHMERFGRPDLAKPAEPPVQLSPQEQQGTDEEIDPDAPFEVEMARTGVTFEVGPGQSILGEARKHRQGLSFNCSDGYCGTCETAVLAGRPDHRDTVLSDEEKAEGATMMICVGRSCSRKLVLDL